MSDVDWATELHREVVAKLTELMDAEEGDGEEIDTPSGFPWCGCTDCFVRETLTMGWRRFEQVTEP